MVASDDYNSWQENPQSEAFRDRLDTEVIVFEGIYVIILCLR